jgi:hypothetical protein
VLPTLPVHETAMAAPSSPLDPARFSLSTVAIDGPTTAVPRGAATYKRFLLPEPPHGFIDVLSSFAFCNPI